ncbi:hypothetical protein [Nostoc sp. ChiQUE01b]|uniref:hypothetical protein n=1 Tax=Nostoc sp. ChiQUE01b TaxID=3075376 RepID=UPI002AD3FB65|nr:hypothetical protein [Nostoc sp. ChiQUE01b]MDZ8258641.1 hypothetical protein [Nostoc sp. ChiQUE01b]
MSLVKDYSLKCNYQNEWSLAAQWELIVDGDTVDFFMSYGMDAVNAIAQNIPKITVAAIF